VTATLTNPVWPGYFADPFILAAEGRYHAFGTGEGVQDQHLVGMVSRDLVTWQEQGPVLDPGTAPGGSTHLWAPEVARIDGIYFLYYSAGVGDVGHRIRAATSQTPQGPYRDLGMDLTDDEPFAIDPHPFKDHDGNWFLFYAVDRLEATRVGTTIVVDRLLDPTHPAGAPQPVVAATADWQLYLPSRRMYGAVYDWHTCEGPFVVYRRGRYWCLYSGGNWQQSSYGVSVASAPGPLGPWTERPSEVPLVLRTRPGVVHGPGHASVLTDRAGVDWLVYHAWDARGVARRMFMDRLDWSPTGPVCEGPSTTAQPAPTV
jgi:beta-xylosidase